MESIAFSPIGYVRAARREKRLAPRQPGGDGESAVVELTPRDGLEDALADLEGFDHIWIVFVFHEAGAFAPKVLPPRSSKKRGVLATRSPHRPNPIGLSAVRLRKVDGLRLHIDGADMLDGTPVLDVKPYVAYVDAIPEASAGWLAEEGARVRAIQEGRAADPIPRFSVVWSARARDAASWLAAEGASLAEAVDAALALGPAPHAYRRIKKRGDALQLSVKEWRVDFRGEGSVVHVERVRSGYRPSELLHGGEALALHVRFVEIFGS